MQVNLCSEKIEDRNRSLFHLEEAVGWMYGPLFDSKSILSRLTQKRFKIFPNETDQ